MMHHAFHLRSQRGLLVQGNIYISPGHRSVINDFINNIKRELNLKRSLNSTNHSDPKGKKQKDQHTETHRNFQQTFA